MTKPGWVYLLASARNGTLYLGVTSNLAVRIGQHRSGVVQGFAKDYGCRTLVWFEGHDTIDDARLRDWRMKKWKRAWKIGLIERDNPHWRDLAAMLNG